MINDQSIRNENTNISIEKFFLILKQNSRKYVLTILFSGIIGLIVAFSIPKSYTTKIMLAPEANTNSLLGGGVSSLSSLIGMNMSGSSSDAILPEIYPDVVSSTNFLVGLSEIHVKTIDGKISTTLYDFIENNQKSPWWAFPQYFEKKKGFKKKINPYKLDKKQSNVIKSINNSITCSVNKNNGVITIKAIAQDPLISAVLADSVSSRLQSFITDYRTNKARNDLSYIQKMYTEAKKHYEQARQRYGSFADVHQNIAMASVKAQEEDLENEMQLQYSIYSQVTTQLQMARAKVIEKTPVYAIIQPASVPYRQSSPKRMLITIGFVLIACMGYTSYLMLKK